MKFEKMHAAGNDYIYVNLFEENVDNPFELSLKLSDRHFGVGGDGLVLIGPSVEADFSMRMFNADGSEGLMCGNAARCVGKYLYERCFTQKKEVALETISGIKYLSLFVNTDSNTVDLVRVNMGKPIIAADGSSLFHTTLPEMINYPVHIDEREYNITFVSMGNPHAVIFRQGIDSMKIEQVGPKIENHNLFPERTNVEFVEVINRQQIKMRVWERGSGETLACGTGACASVVASVLTNQCDSKATVQLKGGKLQVEWDTDANLVYLTGDAHFVFKGEI